MKNAKIESERVKRNIDIAEETPLNYIFILKKNYPRVIITKRYCSTKYIIAQNQLWGRIKNG